MDEKQLLEKIWRNKKAISPVIATVIIVAVAIAVAIAVAYWVTGIIPAFTRNEELRYRTAYIQSTATAIIVVKNTGSADATIDHVLVNGRLPANGGWTVILGSATLGPGEEVIIEVTACDYPNIKEFQSGVVYDFTVHTAGGGMYPISTRAP